MPTLSVGQSQLYYEVHGNGEPMLLVHGVGGNHAGWYAQLAAFSERYRVINLDQRGFGNSTDVEGHGRNGMTDDLVAVLDALDIKRVILVAQSMGGGPSIGLACRDPKRVKAMVLADTLVGLTLPDALEAQMAEVRAKTADLTQIERVIGRRTRERDPDRAALYSQIASFNSVTLRTIKGKFQDHAAADLARTGVPILFVAGEDDILAPPPIVRAVQQTIPGSHYHEIAEAGHSAHFEKPANFNAAVLDFLSSLNPR